MLTATIIISFVWLSSCGRCTGCQFDSCLDLSGRRTCYSTNPRPYRLYATITKYGAQRRALPIPEIRINRDCRPIHFNMITRHMTRYPEKEQIKRMRENLPRLQKAILDSFTAGKSRVCLADIERFEAFKVSITDEELDLQPTKVGDREARELGRMYKRKFPEILDSPYDSNRFLFEYTNTERTMKTAQSIATGIFGEESAESINGRVNNDTLHFFDQCDEYQEKCGVNLKNLSEVNIFKNGQTINEMIQSVSKRLGIPLTYDDIYDMYDGCRYGYALELEDIWCGAFSRDDLEVLEYAEDIKYYWKDGYGSDINRQVACPVAKSLISSLWNAAHGDGRSRAIIQVTHAEELKNIFTMLNIFRDDFPLLSTSLCQQRDRRWNTGIISTFISNLVFVLYRCHGWQHKVLVLHNERPIVIGGCNTPFCDLTDIVDTYRTVGMDCNIKKLCCPCCE